MYLIQYGKLKTLKGKDFSDFFTNNEDVQKLENGLPNGVKYKGAYFVVEGKADHHVEVWYEIENFAVLDKWNIENPKWKDFIDFWFKKQGLIFDGGLASKYLKPVGDVKFIDKSIIKQD